MLLFLIPCITIAFQYGLNQFYTIYKMFNRDNKTNLLNGSNNLIFVHSKSEDVLKILRLLYFLE